MEQLKKFIQAHNLEDKVASDGDPHLVRYQLYNHLKEADRFDGDYYRAVYPDIDSSWDPLFHFLYFGIDENRLYNLNLSAAETLKSYDASDRPRVSVLLPVYNNAEYLEECFASVCGQTLEDLEIIIIDDGSTDPAALRIMDRFEAQDPRVRVIHKKNSGYGHSMNVGLDAATGEFIGIVESDDFILPGMYQHYYNIAKKNRLDFVKSNAVMFYGPKDNRFYEERIISRDESLYNRVLNPADMLSVFNVQNVIWNGIYRRDFLLKNKIRFNETPGASYQDNGFWFQTFMHAKRIMFTKNAFYMLRRDNAGSSFFSKDKAFCMFSEYAFIYDKLKEDPELYEKFKGIYNFRKYSNLIFTLRRVDKKYRGDILKRFTEEFKTAFKNGEIDKKIFGDKYGSAEKIRDESYSIEWIGNPKVSIVIPVYNCEEYIGETLEALSNQSEKDIEIICVDDGSTDGSYAVMKNAALRDKRIQLFQQPNSGAGVARNVGLGKTSGDYVIFLDADDIISPELVERQLERIVQTDADVSVCLSDALNVASGERSELAYAVRKEALPAKQVFTLAELRGNAFKGMVGWAWDKIYRRDFLIGHRLEFQNLTSTNDLYFVFTSLVKAKKISLCDKKLITHRINISSSVSNTREKNPLNFIRALEEFKKFLVREKLFKTYERSFVSYAIHSYLWNLKTLKGLTLLKIYKEKENFAKKMGITDHNEDFFLDKREYERFREI